MEMQRVHMVGIGGIGMSALAQLYAHNGVQVAGTDRYDSPVTDLLRAKGIDVRIGHGSNAVSSGSNLMVYSDAVPADNPERVRAQELGIRSLSYFEALGEATRDGVSVVVSGTHGKTTVTGMIAHVLVTLGKEPTVIVGSILSGEGSNFIAGRSDLFVIEGCEYRRHFLHLHPHVLVVNNIELDHTDCFHNLADMQDAFATMIQKVPEGGALVTNTDSPTIIPVIRGVRARVVPYQHVSVPPLSVRGEFNKENARAAKAGVRALFPDMREEDVDTALGTFHGAWRRFEYKGVAKNGMKVYDDYAHHPTAVQQTLTMVRAEFPDTHVVVAFHPHLYSRTRDFMDAFADALALADEVSLAPIYPAREEPLPHVTSEVLAEKVSALGTPARAFPSLDAVHDYFAHMPKSTVPTIVITMGAGDIYTVAERLVGKKEKGGEK